MVRKAGTAVGMELQLMWLLSPIIIVPTSTSTGPVATAGMACSRGAKTRPSRKQAEMTSATMPVFPPSLIPTADSAAMMSGVVPIHAPTAVPTAAARKVGMAPGTRLSDVTRPPSLARPNMAPPMSKIMTSV